MRCPICSSLDDKVVDSRTADAGAAVRRRRECLSCGHRYTTFERYDGGRQGGRPLVVLKRSGARVPFDPAKVSAGIAAAAKGRPVSDDRVDEVVAEIVSELGAVGSEVTSEQIGIAVLECLRELDQVAYMRFASVYKGFDDAADFERELGLLTKETAPKVPPA